MDRWGDWIGGGVGSANFGHPIFAGGAAKGGFKRWGYKQIPAYLKQKAFSGFPRSSSNPPENGEKGRKQTKNARKGPFLGRAARYPLNPNLLGTHLRQPIFAPSFCETLVLKGFGDNAGCQAPEYASNWDPARCRVI